MKTIMRNFALGLLTFMMSSATLLAGGYKVTNLVSDNTTLFPARFQDPNLVNPWGISFFRSGNLLVADNGPGLLTSYKSNGRPLSLIVQLVTTLAPPAGPALGAPTGLERNDFRDAFFFKFNSISYRAEFITVTENGQIIVYSDEADPVNGIVVIDNSGGTFPPVYKGLAIGRTCAGDTFLFVSNFRDNVIEVYDSSFTPVAIIDPALFADPTLPHGFAPFNLRVFDGNLYVTYALQDAFKHDDVAGPGNGFVNIFSLDGRLVNQLIKQGELNSPWGLAIAPRNFGEFSGALLVGNFGNGVINAFDKSTGEFFGQLRDCCNTVISIQGLWSIKFSPCDRNTLYFTAGTNHEADGTLGKIRADCRRGDCCLDQDSDDCHCRDRDDCHRRPHRKCKCFNFHKFLRFPCFRKCC